MNSLYQLVTSGSTCGIDTTITTILSTKVQSHSNNNLVE